MNVKLLATLLSISIVVQGGKANPKNRDIIDQIRFAQRSVVQLVRSSRESTTSPRRRIIERSVVSHSNDLVRLCELSTRAVCYRSYNIYLDTVEGLLQVLLMENVHKPTIKQR